ncbi:right-handed parallel beta-helix repeat-containing protein [Halorussus gelatinilyticus]|uniref:Right-handed parallel beta-helix repeat-containing protein n=1 Tax=Halorussus gelatinilyticus TaxID=2937524 RepID=A0A8U0IN69_9EURY|nr:right-handed parallel beta-helix repeat-containing protein [Halorussus gelatinilyticus]UPW02041.1 right-handed parallel beta-helix repeat-containing protein [Halorussus gelatinilyticus]
MNRALTRTLALFLVVGLSASPVGLAAVAVPADASADPAAESAATVAPGEAADAARADVTYVEDDVTENTTWTAEGGPYRIAADVTVEEGATLTVEPGTAVQPAADIRITVEGNLTVAGAASDPVTIATAPQAPDDVRWASIRYEGGPNSRLSLSHVTVENATTALTVGSSAGRLSLSHVTVRNVSRDGVRVADVARTPRLTVEDSTFADVGGRGVALTPGTGAVGESRVTSNSTEPSNRTEHQIALRPGLDTTMDALRVSYRGHGDVSHMNRSSFRRFGLDLNDNGSVERSLLPLVKEVNSSDKNSYEIRLRRSVTIPADATLRVAYEWVENPNTYGTYPVEVAVRTKGVAQTATTVLPFRLRSDGGQPALDEATSRVGGVTVRDSTFESVGEQGVFVAADEVRNVRVTGNSVSDARGSGIALRGREVGPVVVAGNRLAEIGPTADGIRVVSRRAADLTLRKNRVSRADAGIGLYAHDGNVDRIRLAANVVTDSATGLRVRHRPRYYSQHLSLTAVDNRFADNRGRGVSVVAPSSRVRNLTVRGNEISGNGRAGLVLRGNEVARIALRNNDVRRNDAAGVRVLAGKFLHSAVRNNTLADNRGDGFVARTELVVHDLSVAENRVLDNAGVGLNVDNSLTHAGAVNLTDNLVAANAYGIRVAGAFGGRILNNTVVYNTYGGAPVPMQDYRPGTGIVVEEGEAGAIFRTGDVSATLERLVDDRQVEEMLDRRVPDTYTVVLRPNRAAYVWEGSEGALAVRALSEDIPTGVVLRKSDENRQGVVVRGNDVYGHVRGMVVNVSTLVDANTTTRLFVNATRTVVAERNYWGADAGPTHASIHPEGTGDLVVTRQGWVDFIPSASSPFGPRRERPVANVTASPNPAPVGERVLVSGTQSSDADGRVETYRFRIRPPENGTLENVSGPTRSGPSSPEATATFQSTGNYTVSLVVEDDLGVESASAANATVAVRNRSAIRTTTVSAPTGTTTANASESPATTTTLPDSSENGLFPQLTAFTTLGGLLGLLLYGGGLVLGGVGAVQTVRRAGVSVGGKTINGLAVAGIAVWVVSGLLGTDGLLALGVGGGALWVALVVLLWALVRFVLD